jgi:hypothetical protein
MSGPESLTSVSVDRLPFRLPHATAGRPKKPSRLCLDLVPLSAEVLDAAFEHVADRLAARGCHERPNGAGDDGAVCDPFALNEWGRRMARANIGKTDLSDISLLKSEIFAIVFRWIG